MTTMPEDFRTLTIGTTAVTGLISTRCHYNHLPEKSDFPHVWFRVTSDDEELTMDGVGGIHEADVDLECAGLTEASAQAVSDAVKARLHGYKGTMGNVSAKGIFVSNKDDDYEPFTNQSDEGVHVIAHSVKVWYST